MNNSTLAKLAVSSNLARPALTAVKYHTVSRLSRLSSVMEPLENRTMMSVAHSPLVTHAKAPKLPKAAPLPALVVPTTLAIAAASPTSVKVTWNDPGTNATGYNVLRSTNGAKFTQTMQITAPTTLNYVDTAVKPDTTYTYEVQAYNANSTSANSSTVTIKTPLATPTGLTATAQSGSTILLGWKDNDTTAAGYLIFRSSDGVNFIQLKNLAGALAASFSDTTVNSGQSYKYAVQAYQGANTSAMSAIASGTTPLAAPSGLTTLVKSSSLVHLTWTAKASGATGYLVLRSTDGVNYTAISTLATTSTNTFDDTTVLPFTTYHYELEATTAAAKSAPSNSVLATTPLAVPAGTTAIASGATSIKLTWSDTDPAARGYVILRATDATHYTQAGLISSGTTTTWTDNTVTCDKTYSYEIEAVNGSSYSAASSPVTVSTPMSAPTGLTANLTGSSVKLSWTDTDPTATQYVIQRSVNGSALAILATVSGGSAATYIDNTVLSGHSYSYDVLSAAGTKQSAMSNSGTAVTPLVAPTGVVANSSSGSSAVLTWTSKDSNATGYNILRSSDGTTFTPIGKVSGAGTCSYTDNTVAPAHSYYYQVQAYNAVAVSSATASAKVTTPAANSVTIAIRNTNELVITATGADDTVSVSQSGSTLTIVADGQTSTQPAPLAGLFIYTRGGTDNVNVDQSVTVRTTVETIDAAVDDITTKGSNVSVWDDSTDVYTGTATVHTVKTFAAGVAKTIGASLSDPFDAGGIMHVTGSLWGTGPVAADVNQGNLGDCYFLSSLAAFAGEQPALLQQSAVDMGDGTYTVQYISNGSPEFIRVSNDISTYGNGSYAFARPGASGSLWAVIMEKAYAFFRSGANTYASLNSGWMGNVYSALGVNSTFFDLSSVNAGPLYTALSADLASGKEVTLGTSGSAPGLVSNHAYTLISCTINASGVASYVVRNPWGVSGDSLENSQGYATLTFAQMQANFVDCCEAI